VLLYSIGRLKLAQK